MGARVKTISDEMVVSGGVHDLDPDLLITTAQLAMLLGCAVSGVAEGKRSGRPPLPRQPDGTGTKVSYLLGEVLEARRSALTPVNAEVRRIQQDHIRGFPTFAAFLAEGHLSDQWPIAMCRGRPIDFIASLGIELDQGDVCQWVLLGQYLDRLKAATAEDESLATDRNLELKTGAARRLNARNIGRL